MKILILKFRNIGDVLLITPLLDNLKLHYPTAIIDVSINKETIDMLQLNKNINKIIAYDRNKIKSFSLFKRIYYELNFYLSFRKKYDLVINLTEGDRGSWICKLSKAKIRIGYKNKNKILKNAFNYHLPKQEFRHTIETNLDPLRLLNIPIKDKKVSIFWDSYDEEIVDTHIKNISNFVHIHPVSRWLFKCISDKTFSEIIDYIELKLNTKVVLTASLDTKELDKINNILQLCKSNPVNLAGMLTLKQTAALNGRAKFFIGVDTAIMHISAANDIPVISFFGPSGGDHWGPWDNSLIISGYNKRNGIQSMGKHLIIAEKNKCQPCGQDGCNGTKISNCLMNLDLNIIKKYIKERING